MYRWIEHTAELELSIEAPTREAVFEDALAAFAGLVQPDGDAGEPAHHTIVLASADPQTLLADWLSELVYLADAADFVPERLAELALADQSLRAVVEGRRSQPSPLVKAVTYHGLELTREESVWRARVVLDV